uniref:histone H1.10-like n=1 Tax=Pristiophorus japonicus TaxID=55135 RepID=UPI00398F793E
MADIAVAAQTDAPAAAAAQAAALAPSLPTGVAGPAAALAVAKKKSAYRLPKTGTNATAALTEQILEAVAATKERQAAAPATLATMKKTISASGYELEKGCAGLGGGGLDLARSSHSLNHHHHHNSKILVGGGPPASAQPETAVREAKKKPVRPRKPSPKRAAAKKTHKNVKGPKVAKKSKTNPRKAPKRPAASRTAGRKQRAPKKR